MIERPTRRITACLVAVTFALASSAGLAQRYSPGAGGDDRYDGYDRSGRGDRYEGSDRSGSDDGYDGYDRPGSGDPYGEARPPEGRRYADSDSDGYDHYREDDGYERSPSYRERRYAESDPADHRDWSRRERYEASPGTAEPDDEYAYPAPSGHYAMADPRRYTGRMRWRQQPEPAPRDSSEAPGLVVPSPQDAAPNSVGMGQSSPAPKEETPAAASSAWANAPAAANPETGAELLPQGSQAEAAPLTAQTLPQATGANGALNDTAPAAVALAAPADVARPALSASPRPLDAPASATNGELAPVPAAKLAVAPGGGSATTAPEGKEASAMLAPSAPVPHAARAGLVAAGSGTDTPLATCSAAVERGKYHVSAVDSAASAADGWEIKGRTSEGLNFTCQIDGKGQVSLLDFDDLVQSSAQGARGGDPGH